MSEHTRREFLYWTLPGAVVAGSGLSVLQPLVSYAEQQPPPAAATRAYTAGKFALEIDGQFAGWVQSVEGGHATSDVVAAANLGPDNIQKKHIANVKYEDITVNCGTGMSKNFYDWIKASFDKQFSRKNGAVITADYNGKQTSRLNWNNALITEVGFPALDASSKDAAKMTIKFSPESTRQVTSGAGTVYGAQYKNAQTAQKKWLPANFRLQIAGLETACTRVNKIEAITLQVPPAVKQPVGVSPVIAGVPPHAQTSNLAITLPEADYKPLYDWHESFVIKGNSGAGNEKSGTLSYLTPDLKEALFTLTFRGLGIVKLTPEKVEAGSENIRRVKAEMYCKEMTFAYGAAWA